MCIQLAGQRFKLFDTAGSRSSYTPVPVIIMTPAGAARPGRSVPTWPGASALANCIFIFHWPSRSDMPRFARPLFAFLLPLLMLGALAGWLLGSASGLQTAIRLAGALSGER